MPDGHEPFQRVSLPLCSCEALAQNGHACPTKRHVGLTKYYMARTTVSRKLVDGKSDQRHESLRDKTSQAAGARIQNQVRAIQGIRRQIYDEVFSLELSRLRLSSASCPDSWSPFIVNNGDLRSYFKVPVLLQYYTAWFTYPILCCMVVLYRPALGHV